MNKVRISAVLGLLMFVLGFSSDALVLWGFGVIGLLILLKESRGEGQDDSDW